MKDEGTNKEWGAKAQQQWKDKADEYQRQGYERQNAEALAAEDIKAAWKKEAGEKRHVYLARISNARKQQLEINNSTELAKDQTRRVEKLDMEARSITRRFNARLGAFLKEHHRNILGSVTKPAQMRNIVREMHGEATGDAAAKALSDGITDALEDLRLMHNEAGGIIGKLENWGMPHSHNRRAITQAKFDTWFQDIQPKINWKKMEDELTGRPFQAEGGSPPSMDIQRRFLQDIYDNIAYGKGTRDAVYGRPQGEAMYKRRAKERVLKFKSADDWIEYNKKFGSGDPFNSLMGHVHGMARDIVAMRAYGPNPNLGIDYRQQLAVQRARSEGMTPGDVEGNGNVASRMFKVQSGGGQPETLWQDYTATFFSSARHIMTAAFLDRAVIASVSDLNTMRLAAQSVGMNPANVIARHVDLMKSQMSRDDALRAGWIADTLADPGAALARFQSEVPASEVAERLSSASMRVQGLAGWTDQGRIAFQMEMAGYMASQSGKKLRDVDPALRDLLRKSGVTEAEWAAFTDPKHMFTAGNGATFASPMWWRESTDMPKAQAEDLFFKIQSMIEEQTEFAVPTQNLLARGYLDPAAFGLPPGSLPYEVMKSGLMFKSFAMTFTVNQFRRMMAQPTLAGRVGYGMNLAAGATVMGAVALQLGELIKGNDPQPMDTPDFWGRATLKGGGFGIVGDIVSTGEASWGGGFPTYVAGPVPQLLGDAWAISIGNGIELATGEDTNFASELSRIGKRYTPMGQTPMLGPALDRLFWDQLQNVLDPDAGRDFQRKATVQENRYGNGSWWMPGSPLPDRAPSLGQ